MKRRRAPAEGTAADRPASGPVGPTSADLARYAAAALAADAPNALMDVATDHFAAMTKLVRAGDRSAAAGAAVAVSDACITLCVAPAGSARASDERSRFLGIMAGWAWRRAPALAAVLEAARQVERARWGGDVGGRA